MNSMIDEDALYRLIGSKIRAARQRVSPPMSQAKLAMQSGLSRASVVNIEAGRQRAPIHVLWQIAEALRTEPSLLIPKQSEYTVEASPRLSPEIAKEIAKAAKGDSDTLRKLAAFISTAQTRLIDNE
jgi:transcriptional regulator with XRE-family HTH domain